MKTMGFVHGKSGVAGKRAALIATLVAGAAIAPGGGGRSAFAQLVLPPSSSPPGATADATAVPAAVATSPVPQAEAKREALQKVRALIEKKKPDEALRELDRLDREYPNDEMVHVAYALTYWKKGDDVRPDKAAFIWDREKRRKEKAGLYAKARAYFVRANQCAVPSGSPHDQNIALLDAEIQRVTTTSEKERAGSSAALANLLGAGQSSSSSPASAPPSGTAGGSATTAAAGSSGPNVAYPLYLTGDWVGQERGGRASGFVWKFTLNADGSYVNNSTGPNASRGTWTHENGVVRLYDNGKSRYILDVYKADAMLSRSLNDGTPQFSFRRTRGPSASGSVATAAPVWTGKWKDGDTVEMKLPSGWQKATVIEAPTTLRGNSYTVRVEYSNRIYRGVAEIELR